MERITEDKLLHVSAVTSAKLEDFVTAKKWKVQEQAHLARQLNKEMGIPTNMEQALIMMQVLRQLWENEHKLVTNH